MAATSNVKLSKNRDKNINISKRLGCEVHTTDSQTTFKIPLFDLGDMKTDISAKNSTSVFSPSHYFLHITWKTIILVCDGGTELAPSLSQLAAIKVIGVERNFSNISHK